MGNFDRNIDSSLKIIAKSSIIVFLGIFISKVFTYIYKILIARHYGPEIYGVFSLAIMVVGWFISFSAVGLTGGLSRFLPLYLGKKKINKARYLIRKTNIFLLISGIVFGVLLFGLSEYISLNIFKNQELIIFLRFFSILIPISLLFSVFLPIIQAFENIKIYSFIFNILQNVVKVLSIFLLILLGFKYSIHLSYILGGLSVLLFSYIYSKRKYPDVFKADNLSKMDKSNISSELFSYSWPLLFSGIITFVFYWIDLFILGYFKTALDVGLYSAAVSIAMLFLITPELFLTLFFPLVTKEYSKKKFDVVKKLSQQVGKWIFILNIPILILILIFPGTFLNILFGKEYLLAENSLRILSVGIFFGSILSISEKLLSIAGKSKLILLDIVISSIINIFLGVLLVKEYGINGVALSTSISIIFLNILLLLQTKKFLSIIPIKRDIFKISLAGILSAFILLTVKYIFKINLLVVIFLGVFFLLIYFILILLTCLDSRDFSIIYAFRKKIGLTFSLNPNQQF